jgi:polyisoprenoid-binding protein YceI
MTATQTGVSTWIVDQGHSTVEFSVKHAMITTVRGSFQSFAGTIQFDEANPANSVVNVDIDAASVTTNNEQRDAHLRTGDFFDAETHPRITFESTRVEAAGKNRYRVTGNLSIRGVTHEVTLDAAFEGIAKDPWGMTRAGFEATTEINRKAWGLNWNQPLEVAGGLLVSDNVKIHLHVSAVQA